MLRLAVDFDEESPQAEKLSCAAVVVGRVTPGYDCRALKEKRVLAP